MQRSNLNRGALAVLASLALLAGAALVQAAGVEDYHKSLPAAKDGSVRIENVAGSVVVAGWERAEIEVSGTLDAEVKEVEFTVEGRNALVKVILPRRSRGENEAHLEIKVPRDSRLFVETVSAEIEVAGVRGDLELDAVSGGIAVDDISADVEVQTVSGAIVLTGRPLRVQAESVSGEIELAGGCGEGEVSTVSGGVVVRAETPVASFSAESVSGDLDFTGALETKGSLSLETHSGEIMVTLPGKVAADFDISTFSGDIDNEFGPRPKRTDRFTPSQELHFSTGNGGARVDLTSFSGDVRLQTR